MFSTRTCSFLTLTFVTITIFARYGQSFKLASYWRFSTNIQLKLDYKQRLQYIETLLLSTSYENSFNQNILSFPFEECNVISVKGPDRIRFLNGLATNSFSNEIPTIQHESQSFETSSVAKIMSTSLLQNRNRLYSEITPLMKVGSSFYSAFTNGNGKLIGYICCFILESEVKLLCEDNTLQTIYEFLNKMIFPFDDVKIEKESQYSKLMYTALLSSPLTPPPLIDSNIKMTNGLNDIENSSQDSLSTNSTLYTSTEGVSNITKSTAIYNLKVDDLIMNITNNQYLIKISKEDSRSSKSHFKSFDILLHDNYTKSLPGMDDITSQNNEDIDMKATTQKLSFYFLPALSEFNIPNIIDTNKHQITGAIMCLVQYYTNNDNITWNGLDIIKTQNNMEKYKNDDINIITKENNLIELGGEFALKASINMLLLDSYDDKKDKMNSIPPKYIDVWGYPNKGKYTKNNDDNISIQKSKIWLNAMRISSGRPLYSKLIDYNVTALECGLVHTIHFTKGCFSGQEFLSKAVSMSRKFNDGTSAAIKRRIGVLKVTPTKYDDNRKEVGNIFEGGNGDNKEVVKGEVMLNDNAYREYDNDKINDEFSIGDSIVDEDGDNIGYILDSLNYEMSNTENDTNNDRNSIDVTNDGCIDSKSSTLLPSSVHLPRLDHIQRFIIKDTNRKDTIVDFNTIQESETSTTPRISSISPYYPFVSNNNLQSISSSNLESTMKLSKSYLVLIKSSLLFLEDFSDLEKDNELKKIFFISKKTNQYLPWSVEEITPAKYGKYHVKDAAATPIIKVNPGVMKKEGVEQQQDNTLLTNNILSNDQIKNNNKTNNSMNDDDIKAMATKKEEERKAAKLAEMAKRVAALKKKT